MLRREHREGTELVCADKPHSQFKRVTGPQGTLKSICMRCLRAVTVCFSADDLSKAEAGHHCHRTADGMRFEFADPNRFTETLEEDENSFNIAGNE